MQTKTIAPEFPKLNAGLAQVGSFRKFHKTLEQQYLKDSNSINATRHSETRKGILEQRMKDTADIVLKINAQYAEFAPHMNKRYTKADECAIIDILSTRSDGTSASILAGISSLPSKFVKLMYYAYENMEMKPEGDRKMKEFVDNVRSFFELSPSTKSRWKKTNNETGKLNFSTTVPIEYQKVSRQILYGEICKPVR